MSLIADALQKKIPAPAPPAPSRTPRSLRPGRLYVIAGVTGLALIGAARSLILQPSVPSRSRPAASSASGASPLGLSRLNPADHSWQLTGIIRGGASKPLALINGEVVEEGHAIRGARVIRVASDEVDLETDGKIRTLKLR